MGLWWVNIRSRSDQPDPAGDAVRATLADFGFAWVEQVRASRLFLIEFPPGHDSPDQVRGFVNGLLCDPVVDEVEFVGPGCTPAATPGFAVFEVHLKPGVMDNVAASTFRAADDMGLRLGSVRCARRYLLSPVPNEVDARHIAMSLGNSCIEDIVVGTRPIAPAALPPTHDFKLRHVEIAKLDDSGLADLSARAHLFLSLEEMRTIQRHFAEQGRAPTDLELETLAQTWSEHCVHKTMKSAIVYRGAPMPGQVEPTKGGTVTIRYENLLKDTIAKATHSLMREGKGPECLSVFEDNAGVIGFDDTHAIAFKVETHNHPSAIEPYGGASTGVGGVIRDVMGCGLGAQPIANTDVFCVAPPDWPTDAVPTGLIHPKTVLKGVVAGVRDYGNRMGIPTVNGAVHFDPRYLGNPLVYCGCVGLIPRDRISKGARAGDAVVLIGGRTGRDGIHGATFSSVELTDTHADEFAHAVQIGNAIEEKKMLDVVLRARDFDDGRGRRCLFSAITDCGAGGLSSAVGEMAAQTGAEVDVKRVPLKYAGLRYDEIWISEAQERMVLAVPPEYVNAFLALAASEEVEATVIGQFNDSGRLVVRYGDTVVGDLDLRFLHEGLPRSVREATWDATTHGKADRSGPARQTSRIIDELKRRLSDPTAASKHWIIRQYDHEVGGRSVVKPLVGRNNGPADAAVIRPRLDSNRGIAIGCGLASNEEGDDPYWTAVASIDEAIRNIVCVGGDPERTAILDNFCWPRVDDKRNLGALVRASQACHDAARIYGTPFISGKDSLNNEFVLSPEDVETVTRLIRGKSPGQGRIERVAIPYTLLISAVALVDDVAQCVTSAPPTLVSPLLLYYVGMKANRWEEVDLRHSARLHRTVAALIRRGDVLAAHDCGDGGWLVSAVEMALTGDFRMQCVLEGSADPTPPFATTTSAYVLALRTTNAAQELAELPGVICQRTALLLPPVDGSRLEIVGEFGSDCAVETVPMSELRAAWQGTLDW